MLDVINELSAYWFGDSAMELNWAYCFRQNVENQLVSHTKIFVRRSTIYENKMYLNSWILVLCLHTEIW